MLLCSQESPFHYKEAEFPGGTQAMRRHVQDNLKYPEESFKQGDEGRVFIEFVVKKDGSIDGIKVLRGVSVEIDNEAIRIIEIMPRWIPAEEDGEKREMRCRMPINFILPSDYIYDMVDKYAAFPGGPQKLEQFIAKKVKYPKQSKRNGVEGEVILEFVVNQNGSIENIKVLKGVSKVIDSEAIRVIQMMPKWTPAEKNNTIVRSKCSIPIDFVLKEKK